MTDDPPRDGEPPPAPAEPEPAATPPTTTVTLTADEPLEAALPLAASTDDLREAVGVPRLDDKAQKAAAKAAAKAAGQEAVRLAKEAKEAKRKAAARDEDDGRDRDDAEDDEDGPPKKRGKMVLVLALSVVVGGVIASMVLVGQSNAERYLFTCGEQRIIAEQGRSFPPWGAERLGGAEWKPIAIPPGVECESRETDDPAELTGWYLEALVGQAESKLTAKDVTAVDEAQKELEQALLLARDPDRRDQRKTVDRLLGDVEYWRGAARIKAAAETLDEAAARFDAASDKNPRHATEVSGWAEFTRRAAAELRAGLGGITQEVSNGGDPTVTAPRPDVPTGVALPVEEPSMTMPDAAPPPAPIDAGLPQGGVLL